MVRVGRREETALAFRMTPSAVRKARLGHGRDPERGLDEPMKPMRDGTPEERRTTPRILMGGAQIEFAECGVGDGKCLARRVAGSGVRGEAERGVTAEATSAPARSRIGGMNERDRVVAAIRKSCPSSRAATTSTSHPRSWTTWRAGLLAWSSERDVPQLVLCWVCWTPPMACACPGTLSGLAFGRSSDWRRSPSWREVISLPPLGCIKIRSSRAHRPCSNAAVPATWRVARMVGSFGLAEPSSRRRPHGPSAVVPPSGQLRLR